MLHLRGVAWRLCFFCRCEDSCPERELLELRALKRGLLEKKRELTRQLKNKKLRDHRLMKKARVFALHSRFLRGMLICICRSLLHCQRTS